MKAIPGSVGRQSNWRLIREKIEQAKMAAVSGDNFTLIWKGIKFTAFAGTDHEKVIIKNVNGVLQSGTLMAFLGPSGAGELKILGISTISH